MKNTFLRRRRSNGRFSCGEKHRQRLRDSLKSNSQSEVIPRPAIRFIHRNSRLQDVKVGGQIQTDITGKSPKELNLGNVKTNQFQGKTNSILYEGAACGKKVRQIFLISGCGRKGGAKKQGWGMGMR